MSIEYTIDIQLTELGYPDILQPLETSVRETPCRSTSPDVSLSHSHPPTSLSTTQVQKLLVRGQQQSADGKEAGAAKQPTVVSPLSETCTPLNPAGQAVKEDTLECPTAAGAGGDLPQLITEQDDDGEKDVDDAHDDDSTEMQIDVEDSDDSEVSMVYEEEEVDEEEDEEEEEEEGLNYESSHSGNYPCSVCDLQLPSKFKLQDHMNLHTGARPYCCAECGKRFCQIYNYRVHLRTHATKTKVDRLQCRICLKSFASQDDLKVHLSRTHFENEFYECDLCKRVFTCLKACEFHVQSHRCKLDLVCDKCGRNFSSPKYLARHQKTTCHRNFKCTDCPMTFTKKNALLRHSFSHLGLLPYTCIRCRCHFRLARLYRKHKCEPERLHCVACLREFLSQEDFQQHKKDTGCWGNQEPKGDEIRCLECGQRFDTSEELKKHAGAHQRVLKCAECGKGFRSALLLMSHMGGHAGNSPCLCQSCGVGFPHQQNYDSHLKTCGKTPQPASAPKKRPASKSSSSETKKVNAKPDSSNATNTAATPAAVSNNPAAVSNNPAAVSNNPAAFSNNPAAFSNNPAAVSNNPAAVSNNPAAVSNNPAAVSNNPAAVSDSPAAPVKDSRSPGLVTEAVSSGSGPSDGLWKLTLNRQPPPGVKLVVFLPVCATQADGLTLPSEISPTLPVPLTQGPPQEAFPPVNAALGAPLNAPLNLVTGIKRDPQWEAPLDLSKKCNLSKFVLNNIPLLPIKRELGEFKISGEQKKKTNPVETDTRTEVKQFKVDAMDFSSFKVNTTSTGLKIDIKKEPQSPGPDCDLRSSRSCQLTEKEIKMEVDTSRPADVEK